MDLNYPDPVNLVESPPHLRFRITSGILHNTTRSDPVLGHHMSDIVYESPDKDGFSTSGWSRDHTGKRMDSWYEMTRKSSAGYFKHEWVAPSIK